MDFKQVNVFLQKNLSVLKTNEIANGIFILFFVLYAGIAAPSLPGAISGLFDYAAVRIALLSLIVWNSNNNPSLSIMIAIGFVLSMNMLSGKKMLEKFELLEPKTNIYPGCHNVTKEDIKGLFESDEKMKEVLRNIGVPFNIPFDDENAPLIATHLINFGYLVDDSCAVPSGDELKF